MKLTLVNKNKLFNIQRRWKVLIWDLEIENLIDEEVNVFIEIDFGTSREEFRVQSDSKEYILSNGELKHRFRTPIIHKLSKENPQKIKFHPSFEYRGSYLDLEKEKLKLSIWRYHNFRLNTLDAVHDIKLNTCANSDVKHNCFLMRINQDHKLEKVYRMSFNLYFQEIFDFQLSLDHWEIKSLTTYQEIMNKLHSDKKKIIETNPINNSTIINFSIENDDKSLTNSLKSFESNYKKTDLLLSTELGEEYLGNLLENKQLNYHNLFSEKKFNKTLFNYKNNLTLNSNINIDLNDGKINAEIKKSSYENTLNNLNVEFQNQLENGVNKNKTQEKKSFWELILSFFGILKKEDDENIQKLDSLLMEAQLDQAKLHPANCNPKLKIKLIWPNPLKEYIIFSTIQKGTNWPIWDNIGSIYLRGTVADLENSFLDVEVVDSSKEKSVNSQARTHIPLKGLIENNIIVESKLSEPSWLVEKTKNIDQRRELATWEFGLITGSISFRNYPTQRQKGNFVHFVKDRLYLMIKITKVDNIITFENLEDPQINVSITHQGLTAKSTNIGNSSKNTFFDDYIIFPLQLPPIPDLYSFHLESLGEVYMDLWVTSKNSQYSKTEHGGYTSFTIWDTIYTIKGIKRPISERNYTCYTSGSTEKLKVRILEQEVQLKFLFPTDRVANISYEAFITPDLLSIKPTKDQYSCSKNKGIAEKIDIFLRSRLELSPSQAPKIYQSEKISVQTILTGKLGSNILGRFFLFSVFNQRGNELMITQFVNPMPTPNNIKTSNAIFHFVRCIPFINTSYRDPPKRNKDKFNLEISKTEALRKNKQEDSDYFTLRKSFYWFTPDFTLLNNGGGIIDHCLLHVSLLLKLKIQAFVCIGTIGGGHFHAWVMSWHHYEFENSTSIKFWELTTGQIYNIKNRFLSSQRAREVTLRFRKRERLLPSENDLESISGNTNLKTIKLPYKSIDTIFNEMNIWYNIQENMNPGCIFFDLWNKSLFVSCKPSPLVHQPGFRSQPFLSRPNKESMNNMKSLIKSVLNYEIQARRNAQNLGTRWNRDPTLELFLEKGLDLIESSELSSDNEYKTLISRFKDWKIAMESKVPPMHRVLGFPLSFNHTNPKLISDTILMKLEILFTRNKSVTLSLAVIVNGYPNNTFCSRVFILVIQKISERERKKVLEKREKEKLKREEKLKKKLSLKTSELFDAELKNEELNNEKLEASEEDEKLLDVKMDEVHNSEEKIVSSESNNFEVPLITGDFIGILDKENNMIRKRRVVLPEGSVPGKLWISKKMKDDGNFRYYIENIEYAVSKGLNISKSRVCATELNYETQRVGFAILPASNDNEMAALDLMYEMALKVEELLKSDERFIAFTGGDAVLEWDYDEEIYETEEQELVDYSEDNASEEMEETETFEETSNSEENSVEEVEEIITDEYNQESESEHEFRKVSSTSRSISEVNEVEKESISVSKHILRRQSSGEISSESLHSTSNKSEFNQENIFDDLENNNNENFIDSISRKTNLSKGSSKKKELKRFTKTGKYIIYKRPEYERSKLKKKEINDYTNKDDFSVYPAATLAISLARGHSELKEKGLLSNGRRELNSSNLSRIGFKESNENNKVFSHFNSSDLLSKMFYKKKELENFSSRLLTNKYQEEGEVLTPIEKDYFSKSSSISTYRI